MNTHPRGSLEHAHEEARARSALYRMTCYVCKLAEHYADEHGVYGWYCYDSQPVVAEEHTLVATYTNGQLQG